MLGSLNFYKKRGDPVFTSDKSGIVICCKDSRSERTKEVRLFNYTNQLQELLNVRTDLWWLCLVLGEKERIFMDSCKSKFSRSSIFKGRGI